MSIHLIWEEGRLSKHKSHKGKRPHIWQHHLKKNVSTSQSTINQKSKYQSGKQKDTCSTGQKKVNIYVT